MVTIAASLGRQEENRMCAAGTVLRNSRCCVGLGAAPVSPAPIDVKCPMSGPFFISRHHCVSEG